MASDEEVEDLLEPEEGPSATESGSGSETVEPEVAVEVPAAQHGYNLRSKRVVPDAAVGTASTKKKESAPGVGAEADTSRVGGRAASDPTKKRSTASDSADPAMARQGTGPDPVEAESRPIHVVREQVVD